MWVWAMPSPASIEGSHSHDYNEIVLNIGSDPENPADLGAEIEAYLGGEKQVTDQTSAVFIPKGVKHGPIKWTKFTRRTSRCPSCSAPATLQKLCRAA